MAFFGPGVTLIPPHKQGKWRQGWWWKERLPRIAAWVGLAALVVGLVWVVFVLTEPDDSGGGQVPEQTAQPGQTAPSATSNRPREDPPPQPAAMSEPTVAGVEATVRYENDAINYAQRTRDVQPLKDLYDLELCAVCRGLITNIEKGGENGRYLEGGQYTVVSVTGGTVGTDTGEPLVSSTSVSNVTRDAGSRRTVAPIRNSRPTRRASTS